jgi:integrase
MTGGVRKRGGTWSYYFDVGTVDGKRKKKEKGGFKTKKEAETALANAISAYNNAGVAFEPAQISVSDYLDLYYNQYIILTDRYNTQRIKKSTIENYLKPRFGEYKLRAITAQAVQEFANDLKLRGLSKSSISGIMSLLSCAMDYAVEPLQYIQMNPCKLIKMPKVSKPKEEYVILEPEEWQRIIDTFPEGNRFHVPLMIGYYAGLRISETFALTWDDIDFEAKTLTVSKQLVKRTVGDGFAWYFGEPKTSQSNRTILIGDTLLEALRREKDAQEQRETEYGEYYTIHVLKPEKDEKNEPLKRIVPIPACIDAQYERVKMVNVDVNGDMTTPDSFKYAARVIHHELQLAFNYHALRHTHATRLIEAGVSPKAVQVRLGHNSILTTLQTYVSSTPDMEQSAVDAFERLTG